jgi:Pyruvate/2-oxoacid:ferredoxin oxidoreductase gamma subunit
MQLNLLICGIGGQGVVFLASFLRQYFLNHYPNGIIIGTESRGVSQREGSVIASIRIQTDPNPQKIFSPEIPPMSADIVIALEPLELLRNFQVVQRNTIIVTNNEPILPKSSIKWMMEKTSDELASSVHSYSKSSWLIARAEQLMNNIPVEFNRNKISQKKSTPNSNPDRRFKMESISSYPGIYDLNFSSLIMEEFEESSNLNLVMLGFLAAITASILDLKGLQRFIESFPKQKRILKAGNEAALKFGVMLATEYVKLKKTT